MINLARFTRRHLCAQRLVRSRRRCVCPKERRPPVAVPRSRHAARTPRPYHPCAFITFGRPEVATPRRSRRSAERDLPPGERSTSRRGLKASFTLPAPRRARLPRLPSLFIAQPIVPQFPTYLTTAKEGGIKSSIHGSTARSWHRQSPLTPKPATHHLELLNASEPELCPAPHRAGRMQKNREAEIGRSLGSPRPGREGSWTRARQADAARPPWPLLPFQACADLARRGREGEKQQDAADKLATRAKRCCHAPRRTIPGHE